MHLHILAQTSHSVNLGGGGGGNCLLSLVVGGLDGLPLDGVPQVGDHLHQGLYKQPLGPVCPVHTTIRDCSNNH